jgi:outer membrane protein assembly factor BamB
MPQMQDDAGNVYMGTWFMTAFRLSARTGKIQWTVNLEGVMESHGAYHNGVVYFSTEDSHALVAMSAISATRLWEWTGSTVELNGSPTLTPDLVYVGSNDHSMHCINRTNGQALFAIQATANVFSSAAVADDGWVFFSDNSVTASDVRRQNKMMHQAFLDCNRDTECALERARPIWQSLTKAEQLGAGNLGHVFAFNPSNHLPSS